ncbi:uncharacterized protein TRUGW13939_09579 [Talaromyces rugulosus]|uniref:Uncharacterized protein n=1 Tax=Talaromyces rugulosus TaxID=121627 RepID=A0A7H8R906_TALRU|nr:uncharacterized protein TRUGW13939_09579 [Talaromyces rugulosus]QKX62418.1 hypothetical protein TRUGW13939_09579 [Talaromyces rugulosus]
MPPKKPTSPSLTESSIKPEDAEFFLQCLKAFDSSGVMDITAVSVAIGHTNVLSTRNAFCRLKKKWGLGNIPTKTGCSGKAGQKADDDSGSGQDDVLKPKTSNDKVVKKRARAAPKSKTSKAALEKENVKANEDTDTTEADVKNEDASEDDA